MSSKVLLVEDERTLSGIVRDALETMDFSVEMAYDGSEGLRQSDKETPILFLTAKTTVDDVVTGFNLGADDYLKKPFAIPELVVRMKTLLGRSGKRTLDQEKGQESYGIGEYQFTPDSATLVHKPTGDSTLNPPAIQPLSHAARPIFCSSYAKAAAASSPPRTSSCPSGATTTSSTPAASRSLSPASVTASPKIPASKS